MSIACFSPFELLLVKSRCQVDTATLLLLAWVLVHRQHVSEGQRRRRLAKVSAQFRHGHELGPVMDIAHSQDLQAIQLAAEIVRKECDKDASLGIMYLAISVSTDDGRLSLANHYILRFLADLLTVSPTTLTTLFKELTGALLATPEDPSRDAYWQAHDPEYHARKARDAAAAEQRQQQAHAREQQHHQKNKSRRQQKEHHKEQRQQRQEHERKQQRQEREQQHKQEQERQQQRKQEEHKRQQRASSSPPDRTARALSLLGLSPGANRIEIRHAYRRMAQLHHPDRFYSESEHQVALASARFQRIKNAYDYLMKTN